MTASLPIPSTILFLLGCVVLMIGAESLVRGASRLARSLGISPLVIGLTVIAIGTSSPEIAITLRAAAAGETDVALGNVVGSNIFNVLVVLGLAAVVRPIPSSRRIVRVDVPLVIGSSLLVAILSLDGTIGRVDGLILFSCIVLYTAFLIVKSRTGGDPAKPAGEPAGSVRTWILGAVLILVGLALLVTGAGWMVDAAVTVAESLGVSELIIGLTIVAAGTSLPEVAASVLASWRGETDMAIGNVVGSNLYNLLAVLGLGGLLAPHGLPVAPGALTFDIPVMVATAVALLPVFVRDSRIARWEGLLFLAYYGIYVTYLILAATGNDALRAFRDAVIYFLLPLTGLTFAVLAARGRRAS